MTRKIFFSFHFDNDFWRTQQVRNMNALEGQPICTPNAWEEVKRRGEAAIEKWIDDNLQGKSCVVVLVGSQTAQRPWVRREIIKGWNAKKGVVAVRIHRLLDVNGKPSLSGANPFDGMTIDGSKKLSSIAPIYDPTGLDSRAVYATIRDSMEKWIETAIAARNAN